MRHKNNKFLHKVFLRAYLPNPQRYYAVQFPDMKLHPKSLWISVLCCFHKENSPSLRINLHSGGFICFGCGVKGGDLVAFHQRRYGLTFIQTVDFFNAWGEV
jgi:hypothetical protein